MNLAITVARCRLQEDSTLRERTCLSVEEVMELLQFCLSATFLAFRCSMHQQTYGTAMGSPVSVTIANLVIEDVKERTLGTTDIPLRFWKRYVDMCTALLANRLQELLDQLNGVEPSIQFLVEIESEGKLPFLDVLLQRDPDGLIATTVYRKSTHTDRYLDFASHHPLAHKIAVVRTLQNRAEAISSSIPDRGKETWHLRQALITNGYHKGVIQRYSTPTTTRPVDLQAARDPGVALPYVRGVSEAIRRILTPLGVKVSFWPNVTLRQLLVRPKDHILESEVTGVMFQVPCASCPATYVGQTGRRLDQRLQEHRCAVESADFASSALAEHAWSCHHPVY